MYVIININRNMSKCQGRRKIVDDIAFCKDDVPKQLIQVKYHM